MTKTQKNRLIVEEFSFSEEKDSHPHKLCPKMSKKLWILKKGSNFILCENINKTTNILLQTEAIMYAEIKMTLFSIMIC